MSAAVAIPRPRPLGRLSFEVERALSRFTAFPWPIMKTRCQRRGIDPAALTPAALGCVLQDLALGVARFAGTGAGLAARRALVDVLREATAAGWGEGAQLP